MDNWFDRLAKAAGRGMSRREALRGAAGGFLGVFGLAAGAGRASGQTSSPYLPGCQLKCGAESGACVDACVACAEGGSIVCTFNGTNYCCPGTYRTCKSAAAKGGPAVCKTLI